jgi:hypothetical protein
MFREEILVAPPHVERSAGTPQALEPSTDVVHFGQYLGDRTAQPSDDAVFFDGDDSAGINRRRSNCFDVEGPSGYACSGLGRERLGIRASQQPPPAL